MNLCKDRYEGFSREIFRLFIYYGYGKEKLDEIALDKENIHIKNRTIIYLLGDMYFFNAIYNILNGVSNDTPE